jgi:hypothetical protein
MQETGVNRIIAISSIGIYETPLIENPDSHSNENPGISKPWVHRL